MTGIELKEKKAVLIDENILFDSKIGLFVFEANDIRRKKYTYVIHIIKYLNSNIVVRFEVLFEKEKNTK